MMKLPKSLTAYWFLFMLSVFLLSAAFFFEYVRGLAPCPLCLTQRLVVAMIGILSLLVILHKPKTRGLRIYGILLFFVSLLGILLAVRQVYLEHLPPSSFEVCMPGINYIIEVLPWQEVLKSMLMGGAECGQITWSFIHLSMAEWLCLVFAFTTLTGFIEIIRKHSVYRE